MVYCDLDQGLAIEPRLSVEECEAALALRWASPHSRQMWMTFLVHYRKASQRL